MAELFEIFQPSFLAMSADPESVAGSAALFSLQSLISLLTLLSLEIVLGIDNIIFIAILAGKLPQRRAGEGAAARHRDGGDQPDRAAARHHLGDASDRRRCSRSSAYAFSGNHLILLGGGLFLIGKATYEIHDKLEGAEEHGKAGGAGGNALASVVVADHGDRHRLLARLGDHRRRHGRTSELMIVAVIAAVARDAGLRRTDQRFRAPPSDDQDAGARRS